MGWNGRRNRCAIPGCRKGRRVFPTIRAGNVHLWEAHGLQGWTEDDGLVMLDPPTAQLLGPRGSAKDFAPTAEEYSMLLAAARDETDQVIFRVLGEAGLRSGELRHLRPSWLRDGWVYIPHRDGGWTAKTPRAARAIPLQRMAPETWDILEDAELPVGISAVTVWQRVRKGGLRAGLAKHLRPHALRAFAATTWAYRLGNPFVLMDLMGWTKPDVAICYVRSTGRGLRDAVDVWNRGRENGHNGHQEDVRPPSRNT